MMQPAGVVMMEMMFKITRRNIFGRIQIHGLKARPISSMGATLHDHLFGEKTNSTMADNRELNLLPCLPYLQ